MKAGVAVGPCNWPIYKNVIKHDIKVTSSFVSDLHIQIIAGVMGGRYKGCNFLHMETGKQWEENTTCSLL